MSKVKLSKESIQGRVFETSEEAHAHGKGGIWYFWGDSERRQFPDDVKKVGIVMPAHWSQALGDEVIYDDPISAVWDIGRWSLSGTREAPTLHPSLSMGTFVDGERFELWHGHLKDGYLRSC